MVTCPKCKTENADNSTNCKFCHINLAHAISHPELFGSEKAQDQTMEQPKSFFESLFDFSFTALITSKIIKLLYGLSIAGAAIVSFFLVIFGFYLSTTFGVLMLIIGAPLFFALTVIYSRVLLEIIIVIFRISEHAAEIADQGRKNVSGTPS